MEQMPDPRHPALRRQPASPRPLSPTPQTFTLAVALAVLCPAIGLLASLAYLPYTHHRQAGYAMLGISLASALLWLVGLALLTR